MTLEVVLRILCPPPLCTVEPIQNTVVAPNLLVVVEGPGHAEAPRGPKGCCCCHSYRAFPSKVWWEPAESTGILRGGCRNCLLFTAARHPVFAGLHSRIPKLTAGLGLVVTTAHTGNGPAGGAERGQPSPKQASLTASAQCPFS